jgi:preprotein translocase subunit YajC
MNAHTLFSLLALQAPAAGGAGYTPLLIQVGLIIAIIYFLMIRPQQKQRRQHEASLAALKRGDEIVTTGGLVGEVIHIKETTREGAAKNVGMDDRITIKSAESRIVVERRGIARIVATSTVSGSASAAS